MRRFVKSVVLLGGLALIVPACGSGSGSGPSSRPAPAPVVAPPPNPPPPPPPPPPPAPVPPAVETFPVEGSTHVPVGTVVVYGTDPPTSGNHYPEPAQGGYYDFPIEAGFLVHSLEHGGIVLYYNPATVTDAQKASLLALAQAHPGVFSQVVCVPRDDPTYPIILTAWTRRLRLQTYDQALIDEFVALYLDQGPEHAPLTPWDDDPTVSNATATSTFTGFSYRLQISATARAASAFTATVSTYSAQPITLSVDLAASFASALTDTQSVQILDYPSSAVLAEAVSDASTGLMTFRIGGVTFPAVAALPGGFHTVRFQVDAGHNATWTVDGTTTSPPIPFGSPILRMGLGAAYSGGVAEAPDFFFQNLFVTYP